MLAEGVGTWDGKITNYPQTQRRDVQIVQPASGPDSPGYLVLQYDTDNNGVWRKSMLGLPAHVLITMVG